MNETARTYVKELGAAMVGYAVVLVLSLNVIAGHPNAAWRFPVALLPVIPLCFALVAFLRFFRRMDELQRKIHFEALAFAFPVTIFLTVGYGFLESVGAPHLPTVLVGPLMIALWGVGAGLASWRYR
ncbi:MAG TPA: hypothetical protein VFL91_21165 [Thermomicrobiales bacterium]|nr:hypothetical protein [Thermomicrobiales bacterium]